VAPGTHPAQALRLAGVAARRHGIADPVRPVRASVNHVFRAGDVVVRVAAPSVDVTSQVALARWLIAEGFRVPAPLADALVVECARTPL
jgi:Ser/Thr protein kinase RdoA (MazF antagonist)